MKKIILSVVFVLASFAMVNANSNVENTAKQIDCSQVYEIVWYAVANLTLDLDLAFDIASAAENDCLGRELFEE